MKTFTATVEFIDVREVTIEAESLDEARKKYDEGDWSSEETTEFYNNREIKPLTEKTDEPVVVQYLPWKYES